MARGYNLRSNENARGVNIAKRQNQLIRKITNPGNASQSRIDAMRTARADHALKHRATISSRTMTSKPVRERYW